MIARLTCHLQQFAKKTREDEVSRLGLAGQGPGPTAQPPLLPVKVARTPRGLEVTLQVKVTVAHAAVAEKKQEAFRDPTREVQVRHGSKFVRFVPQQHRTSSKTSCWKR